MSWFVNFSIAMAVSYALIGLLGFMCKLWFLLFMFGWNLV